MAGHSRYLLCIDNEGYRASLELRKVYQGIGDPEAEARGLVRVIDESGDDYSYPASFFVPIEVPERAQRLFTGTLDFSTTGRRT